MVPKTTDLTGGKWYTPIGSKGTDSGCSLPWKALQAIYVKMKIAPPSWSERLKSVGLVFGTVACGALALGLLPFTIVGGICILAGKHLKKAGSLDSEKLKKAKALKKIGVAIAPPLAGCYACIKELRRDKRSWSEPVLMKWITLAITTPGGETTWGDGQLNILASECTPNELKNIYNKALQLSKTATDDGKIAAEKMLGWLLKQINAKKGA